MRKDPIWGDLSRVDEMRANSVKGNLVLSRRWYLAEHGGADAARKIGEHLGADARKLLERSIMPFTWQPFGLLMDIDRAIVTALMDGDVAKMRGFGYALGVRDLSGIYRAVLGLTSPAFALAKVSALASLYFRDSTLRYAPKSSGVGEVTLAGRPMPLYICAFGLVGWLTAVLEAAKATHIKVEHRTCVHRGGRACAWECRWGAEGAKLQPAGAEPER